MLEPRPVELKGRGPDLDSEMAPDERAQAALRVAGWEGARGCGGGRMGA